jgi:hypothetical protein
MPLSNPAKFPQTQIYDDVDQAVIFTAISDKEPIRCTISLAALQDNFQGHLRPLKAFICNRPAIEKIAERLIAERRFEADGSILISSIDC